MVDIETLSTDRDKGVVLSVGIQSFSLTDEPPAKDFSLYVPILPDTSKDAGRKIDNDTWEWWHKPSMKAAWYRMEKDLTMHGRTFYWAWSTIHAELRILEGKYDLRVWSKGIDFDFPMIESSLRDAGLYTCASDLPYKFYHKYDMRTIANLAKRLGWEDPVPADDVPHSALDDCRLQIEQLKSAYSFLRKGNSGEGASLSGIREEDASLTGFRELGN